MHLPKALNLLGGKFCDFFFSSSKIVVNGTQAFSHDLFHIFFFLFRILPFEIIMHYEILSKPRYLLF